MCKAARVYRPVYVMYWASVTPAVFAGVEGMLSHIEHLVGSGASACQAPHPLSATTEEVVVWECYCKFQDLIIFCERFLLE